MAGTGTVTDDGSPRPAPAIRPKEAPMTEAVRRHARVDLSDIDYPGVLYRVTAANQRVPSAPRPIRYLVIHITGGPAMDEGATINTFASGPASAHYLVNRTGQVIQFVRDAHIANHVDRLNSRTNLESIGIEHVNPWNHETRLTPTDAQYRASARLAAWLCARHGIPRVHNTARHEPGIRGHIEEQPHSGHTACPNAAWDWDRYMSMVQREVVPSFDELIRELAR